MQPPLVGLTPRNLGRELLAGVTLIAIAIPLNIGYAQIAGLPATAGLYALVVPTIVYALVVSSRQLVASPDAAAAALVASSLIGLAAAGSDDYLTMAMAQAIICGVMFVLAAVFKLGFLASFLSKPILVGFVGGLALDILVSQVAKMLGVKIASGGEFLEKLGGLVTG
ncbi:SulP family inorganic anion transporter, partial [Schumannella luteola]